MCLFLCLILYFAILCTDESVIDRNIITFITTILCFYYFRVFKPVILVQKYALVCHVVIGAEFFHSNNLQLMCGHVHTCIHTYNIVRYLER